MTKEFKKIFQPSQPTIRIGTRVPPDSVNLAFVDLPELSPSNTVQVFDYSKRVPQNNTPLHKFESEMYVDNNHILTSQNGTKNVPINNILITSVYKKITEGLSSRFVPLFYKTELRFKHFEKNPPVDPNSNYYIGHNIEVLENSTPTKKTYLIKLEKTDKENVYTVTIYSEFCNNESTTYSVKYTKYLGFDTEVKYHPDFTETLKAEPIYKNLGESEELVEGVKAGTYGLNSFATSRLDEDSYFVCVPDKSVEDNGRHPKIFRWRIIKNGIEATTWKQEAILDKNALYDFEALDYRGRDQYVFYGEYAKKILAFDPRTKFNHTDNSTYLVEHNIWNPTTKQWIEDSSGTIKIEYNNSGLGPVYAYTSSTTGRKDTSNSHKVISYPDVTVPITIEGYMTDIQENIIPPKNVNVCQLMHGASVAVVGLDNYFKSTDKSNMIDGVSIPAYGGMDVFEHSFFVRSKDTKYPPSSPITIECTLPEDETGNPYYISDIDIIMGRFGSVVSAQAIDSSGLVLATISGADLPAKNERVATVAGKQIFIKKHHWVFPDKLQIKKIKIELAPSKWKTRDYWEILNVLGIKDKYRSGFEVMQINAWHRTPGKTETIEWGGAISSCTVNASKNAPYSRSLESIVSDLNIAPPEVVDPNLVRYRVMIGDGTSDSTIGYDELATISLTDGLGGKHILQDLGNNTNANSFMQDDYNQDFLDLPYTNLPGVYLKVSIDRQKVLLSKKFNIKAADETSIGIIPPKEESSDNMWGITVRNGRFVIKDYVQNVLRDYFFPEFNTQPFYPTRPYKKVMGEQVQFVSSNQVKLNNPRLLVVIEEGKPSKEFLALYKESELNKSPDTRQLLPIKDWNSFSGDVYLDTEIEFSEKVYADYIYEESRYVYRGFYDANNQEMFSLDLNPMPGHKYTDLETRELRDSAELLTKDIYLYMLPAYVINQNADPSPDSNGEISNEYIESAASTTLRHIIVPSGMQENEILFPKGSIVLGKILVRNSLVRNMATVIDTRQRGGGFREDLPNNFIESLTEGSGCIWDIGSWDGKPYPVNGVVIITLPKTILDEYAEEEVRTIVEKYIPLGVYAIVRYKNT